MKRFWTLIVLLTGFHLAESQKVLTVDTQTEKGQMLRKKKQKFGTWTYYENGRLVLEYDHNKNMVVFQQSTEDRSYFYKDGEKWYPVAQLEVYPRYKGSYIQFYETIYQNIFYPQKAKDNSIEGVSFLSFEVTTEGEAINPEIINSLGYGCDEQMMKVFKKTKDHWITAIKNGQPLHTRFVVPFVFSFFSSDYQLDFADNLPPAALLDGVNITLVSNRFSK